MMRVTMRLCAQGVGVASSMGVASWPMQFSPTLKVGHQAHSKVSWMGMEEFRFLPQVHSCSVIGDKV